MTKKPTTLLLLFIISVGAMAIASFVMPERTVSGINTFFTGILVIVTMMYVVLTSDILKDSEKSRQINFTSKQLEELYYPLLDFLNDYRETERADHWGKAQQDSTRDQRKLWYSGGRDDAFDGCLIVSDMSRKKYLFK